MVIQTFSTPLRANTGGLSGLEFCKVFAALTSNRDLVKTNKHVSFDTHPLHLNMGDADDSMFEQR